MKLRQIQCFCAIVDHDFNISHAAEKLHATQAGIGKQLRQLEDELGCLLFSRRPSRLMGLTVEGEAALPWARAMMRSASAMASAVRTPVATQKRKLRVATTHTHARYFLLSAVASFSEDRADVQLDLVQGTPEGVMNLVQQQKADIGITTEPAHIAADILSVPFFQMQHSMVAPIGHPLLKVRHLTLDALAVYPIIAHNPSRPIGAEIFRRFQASGLTPHYAVNALDADVMKSYAGAGLGVAVIPKIAFSPRADSTLRARDVGHLFAPTVTTLLLRRGSHMTDDAYQFLGLVSGALARNRLEGIVLSASP